MTVLGQISSAELKKDDGLAILYNPIKMDTFTFSIRNFEHLDDCKRAEGESIAEFIASFDLKYRRIYNYRRMAENGFAPPP